MKTPLCILVLVLPALALCQETHLKNMAFDDGFEAWEHYGETVRHTVVQVKGRGGVLRYHKTKVELEKLPETKENSHLDQTVSVTPHAWYVAGFTGRGDGVVAPVLRLAGMEWRTVALVSVGSQPEWRETSTPVFTDESSQLRVQLFAGGFRRGPAGEGWMDDIVLRKLGPEELRTPQDVAVTVRPKHRVAPVDPRFFGVNSLFMVEDDESRADGKIAALLKDMKCGLLRYPGGEMADNYHWKTGLLNDRTKWPGIDGPGTMDTDEFIRWNHAIGATPIFVVNLESGVKNGDLEAGVREAADWVRHCNIERKYGIRYWEIGNETYLKGTYAPMTARQYATAFAKFAEAMKKVDPTIRIGAVGPRGAETVSVNDRINETDERWWHTLKDVAGDKIDFLVVHEYPGFRDATAVRNSPFVNGDPIRGLRSLFANGDGGRRLEIALTEWNARDGDKTRKLSGMDYVLATSGLLHAYLEAGVEMACFWPMRLHNRSKKWGDKQLMTFDGNQPLPAYELLRLYSRNTAGHIVESASANPEVMTLASDTGHSLAVFLANRSIWPAGMRCRVRVPGRGISMAEGTTLRAHDDGTIGIRPRETSVQADNGMIEILLPPQSVSLVRLR